MSNRSWIIALAFGAAIAPACSASDPADEVLDPNRLVASEGVVIKEIALYQAVKRPLMVGGVPATSDIPVVAGRDALLRVFVDVPASHPLTGRLFLDADPTPIEVAPTIAASSTDAQLSSTLNFDVPGDRLTPTTRYRVVVGDVAGSSSRGAAAPSYPAAGSDSIPAESIGATLKIVIAPIAYGSDGALPTMTEAQMKLYADAFHAMYPAPKVEVTARSEPIVWMKAVSPSGAGWSELLDHVAEVRLEDKVGKDVYYFAPFEPAATEGQFCSGGCVAGLGLLGDPGDDYSRAAIGLGFPDSDAAITALHEIGHNHGRQHAPCDAPDPDPGYPHAGGQDGVWGYDLVAKRLFPPNRTDIMGYCTPVWISDYTYTALVARIKLINGARRIVPDAARNLVYDRVLVGEDGSAKWLSPLRLAEPPVAEAQTLVVESSDGSESVTGAFYRFDHVDGGVLFWPANERPTTAVRITMDSGKTVRLDR